MHCDSDKLTMRCSLYLYHVFLMLFNVFSLIFVCVFLISSISIKSLYNFSIFSRKWHYKLYVIIFIYLLTDANRIVYIICNYVSCITWSRVQPINYYCFCWFIFNNKVRRGTKIHFDFIVYYTILTKWTMTTL